MYIWKLEIIISFIRFNQEFDVTVIFITEFHFTYWLQHIFGNNVSCE